MQERRAGAHDLLHHLDPATMADAARARSSQSLASHVCLLALIAVAHAADGGVPRYEEYPPRGLEPASDPRKWTVDDVQDWVESVGFHEYRNAIVEASIDGRKLMSLGSGGKLGAELMLSAAEHIAVLEMELAELRQRRGLMTGSELKAQRAVQEMDAQDVGGLLQEAGLGEHVPAFEAAGVDGRKLMGLSEVQISALLGSGGAADPYEHKAAALELIRSIIGHLQWRTRVSSAGTGKQEL